MNSPSSPLTSRPAPLPQVFRGQHVELAPVDITRDVEALFALSHADEATRQLWRYLPSGPFADVAQHAAFLEELCSQPDIIVHVVRSTATREMLGSVALMSVRPAHGVAELGHIWYAPSAQRTKANTEACYLLLRHCFEDLGYRRMEWKCDARNEASQSAAERLGFSREGVFRQHMIVKGENRDTVWFAMLDRDWPRIADAMRRWLAESSGPSLRSLIAEDPADLR